MKISQTVKTPEGIVQFQGELSQEEADLVLEAGLAVLMRLGVLKVAKAQQRNDENTPAGIILN